MKLLKTHLREYNPLFHNKLMSLFCTYNHESTEHFEHLRYLCHIHKMLLE